MRETLSAFDFVDKTPTPQFFVGYLDAFNAAEWVQTYKQQAFHLLDVREGDHILDVGCGTGEDVRALAQIVGSTGLVVGIDNSRTMITEAWKRSEGTNLPVEYRIGDAHSLNFDDESFDTCRIDRTLQHVADPNKVLREMARVTRSGGKVVASEPDWGTLLVDMPDRNTTRKIVNWWCDHIRNGWIGRQLPSLFKEAGLKEIDIYPRTFVITDYTLANRFWNLREAAKRAQEAKIISGIQGTRWIAYLEEVNREKRFFAALTGILVKGRRCF